MPLSSPILRAPCTCSYVLPPYQWPNPISDWDFWNTQSGCPPPDLNGYYITASAWINVTQVVSASATIAPFTRPEIATAPQCSPYFGQTCVETGYVACGEPTDNTQFNVSASCSLGGDTSTCATIKSGIFTNCFAHFSASSTASIFIPDSGFKNKYEKKAWHGIPQYTSRTYGAPDTFDWCSQCPWHNQDLTTDDTHYLGCSGSCTYTLTGNTNPDYNGTSYYSFNTLIDRYSGNYASASVVSGSSIADPTQMVIDIGVAAGESSNIADSTIMNVYEDFGTYFNEAVALASRAGSLTGSQWGITISGTPGNWSLTFNSTYFPLGVPTGFIAGYLSVDLAGGSINCQLYDMVPTNAAQTDYTYNLDKEYEFLLNPTSYSKTIVTNTVVTQALGYTTETTSQVSQGTLFNTYSKQDVIDDLTTLCSQWLLGDPAKYPWRTDQNRTSGPLLSYSETPNNTVGPQPGYTPNPLYDGSICGKPMPAGYNGYFDPLFRVFSLCHYIDEETEQECFVRYQNGWGDWSYNNYVPGATQWVDELTSVNLPIGAFSGNSFMWTNIGSCDTVNSVQYYDGYFWAGQWAEKIIKKNSPNFARPCGQDRLTLAYATNRCFLSYDSGSQELSLDPTGAPTNINSGDTIYVQGTGVIDGLFVVNSDNNFTLTITKFLASGSLFPSSPNLYPGTGVVGKVNYPNAPGLCGRTSVVNVFNSPLTCSLSDNTWLISGDRVIITGSNSGSKVDGQWTIVVFNDNTIGLTGSISGSPYTGGGQLYVSNSVDWFWNDTTPKGSYLDITWNYGGFRDTQEWLRLSSSCYNFENPSGPADYQCENPPTGSYITPCTCGTIPAQPRPFLTAYGLNNAITAITCSQHCYNVTNQCLDRSIYYCSPVDEEFEASETLATVTAGDWEWANFDTQYGSLWENVCVQYLVDPLLITPPCVCGYDGLSDAYDCGGCTVQTDDGTCIPNSATPCVYYYPLPALVESMCNLPSGLPAISAGYYSGSIGCLTVDQMSLGVTGSVCQPPSNFGASNPNGYVQDSSWPLYFSLYNNMFNCVCLEGRWYQQYETNGIVCSPDYVAPQLVELVRSPISSSVKGLGDLIAKVANPIAKTLDQTLGTQITGCSGCAKRQAALNRLFPFKIKNNPTLT